MIANANVSTMDQLFDPPPPIPAGGWRLRILGPAPQEIIVPDPPPPVIAITVTVEGHYTGTWQRLAIDNATGIGVEIASSNGFDVTGPVTIKVAASLFFN